MVITTTQGAALPGGIPIPDAVTPALRIGGLITDVWADSTHGPVQLHRWAAGRFTVIFGHPSAYAPLSERDVVTLAGARARFAARNCQILGVTQSDPITERSWVDALSARHGIDVTFPILSDEEGRIFSAFGMAAGEADDGHTVATTLLLDPDLRVRVILEHPQSVGRGPDEILRIVEAIASPASLQPSG